MLEVYTLSQNDKWDSIVKSFANHDVYYLNGYAKGFYLHGDGQPLLFYYEDDAVRGINIAFKRDVSKDVHFINRLEENKYYDLSSPYGYGGFLIEGDGSLDKLNDEYTNWCKQNNIISEIVRFHPVINNATRVKEMYDILNLGKTIAMDLSSEDIIWENITSKNRNVIRKAIKNNVIIKHDCNSETIKRFKEIYEHTMNKDNADDYYYFFDDFYNSIINDLKDNVDIFYAEYNGEIIASSIILKCNGYLTYHFSGFITKYGTLAATNLLLYEVAKYGANNGYKTFHLGGGVGSKQDNLYKFKKSFYRGEDYQYSIGKKIFDESLYNKLVSMRINEEKRDNFFPLYRG